MGYFQDLFDDIKSSDIKQSTCSDYIDKIKKIEEEKSKLMNEFGVLSEYSGALLAAANPLYSGLSYLTGKVIDAVTDNSSSGKGNYGSFVSNQNAKLKAGTLKLVPLDKDLPITFSKSVINKFTPALNQKFRQLAFDYYNEFGSKLNVNDGFRTLGDANYKTNSLHITGNAIDVGGVNKEKTKWIADRAYHIGFGAIDTGKSKNGNYFIHCDVGPKRTYTYGPPNYMTCDTYISPDKPWRG